MQLSEPQVKFRHTYTSSLILEAVLVAALFIRIWGLSSYTYNGDEMQYLIIAKGGSWQEIWQRSLLENHPPLVHFLRHYLLWLSPDAFVQRLFSVGAGLIAVWQVYRLGILFHGTTLGLWCALCMAFGMLPVSTSLTIRDYAFFMVFLLAAIHYFIRYQQTYKPTHLACFATWMFIACATSFGGFMVAAACGIYGSYRLWKEGKDKPLALFIASFLPLAVLAVIFYLTHVAPGTSGPMWKKLALVLGHYPTTFTGVVAQTAMNLYYFFVPFAGIRTLPDNDLWARYLIMLMYLGGAMLIKWQIQGLRIMYIRTPQLCGFVLTVWAVAIAVALMGLYPFSANRQNYYLIPFFILPYGFLLEHAILRILNSNALSRITAFAILATAFIFGNTSIYKNFADELTLKQRDLETGITYLNQHIRPHDGIITGGSAAYFYLSDAKSNGTLAYNNYDQQPYLNNTLLLPGYDAPFKPHVSWPPVRNEWLQEDNAHLVPVDGKYWFVQLGWKNSAIWDLMKCDAVKEKIGDFMSSNGVVIFSLKQPQFAAFLKDEPAWIRCFADYRPLYMAAPFRAVVKP